MPHDRIDCAGAPGRPSHSVHVSLAPLFACALAITGCNGVTGPMSSPDTPTTDGSVVAQDPDGFTDGGTASQDGGVRRDPTLPDPVPPRPCEPSGARWSDAATWGGRVPGPSDDVVIPSGVTVMIDQDIEVGSVTVEGRLTTESCFEKTAWEKLWETAESGANQVVVPAVRGWEAGDTLVITPSGHALDEFDERTITAVDTSGTLSTVTLDRALGHRHEVIVDRDAPATPDPGTVHRFAPEALNLTRAHTLRASRIDVRGSGSVELEDLAIVGTGVQWTGVARGGYTRGVVVHGTQARTGESGGAGLVIEGGRDLLWEDTIVYDVTGSYGGSGGRNPVVAFGWSPNTGRDSAGELFDVYCVRCVAAKIVTSGTTNATGYFVSGLGATRSPGSQENVGAGGDEYPWRGGIVGSVAVGIAGDGGYSSGFRLMESANAGFQYFWRNEAHACGTGWYHDGNHMQIFEDGHPWVDMRFWRNRGSGFWYGSYVNWTESHQFRFLGNRTANVEIQNAHANWNRFVIDGEGVSARGAWFTGYIAPPRRWAAYARTVFRGNGVDIDMMGTRGATFNIFLEFPESDPPMPSTNFCGATTGQVFEASGRDPRWPDAPVGQDEVRFGSATLTPTSCPSTTGPREVVALPDYTDASATAQFIQLPGSRYRYEARRARATTGLIGHMPTIDDWSMVSERLVE